MHLCDKLLDGTCNFNPEYKNSISNSSSLFTEAYFSVSVNILPPRTHLAGGLNSQDTLFGADPKLLLHSGLSTPCVCNCSVHVAWSSGMNSLFS